MRAIHYTISLYFSFTAFTNFAFTDNSLILNGLHPSVKAVKAKNTTFVVTRAYAREETRGNNRKEGIFLGDKYNYL